jgi:hypothetical protein
VKVASTVPAPRRLVVLPSIIEPKRLSRWAGVVALVAGWLASAAAAELIHGADAVFQGGGVSIAWAVARDRDEDKTAVLLSIVDGAKRYDAIEVVGIDPFSNKIETLRAREAFGGAAEISLPRRRFADLPRTELRFYAGGALSLTTYYLGVPDTTPEFQDLAAARRYLAQATR